MENYTRVIPRDFFNEAKLLKCMGQLSLLTHDCQLPEGIEIEILHDGEPFDIQLTDSGELFVSNVNITINGGLFTFSTVYNSKDNYPFQVEKDYEYIRVFEPYGNFTEEFIETFQGIKF